MNLQVKPTLLISMYLSSSPFTPDTAAKIPSSEKMKVFPQLHDATLKQFEFMWAESLLRFHFEIEGGTVCLSAHGVNSMSCDRKLPWGRSVSVNVIEIDQERDASKLTIEMQSGDLIIAWIKTYELK